MGIIVSGGFKGRHQFVHTTPDGMQISLVFEITNVEVKDGRHLIQTGIYDNPNDRIGWINMPQAIAIEGRVVGEPQVTVVKLRRRRRK